VGNHEVISIFRRWVESWLTGNPKQRAAFLYGPSGVGKTVTVEALANDLDLELIEKNASDYRTKEKISKFAGLASQYSSFSGRKRIILLDEMDGVYGTVDRGAIPAISKIISNTRCPIVLIANNLWDKRFVAFRDKKRFLHLEFKKVPAREVFRHLERIVRGEGVRTDEDALKFIVQRSQGDIRSAVNDLQALAQGRNSLTYEDVSWLAYRDRKEVIFTVLRQVLYGKSCNAAKQAVAMADVDLDMLFEWIYENTPYHFNVKSELASAMEYLAMADLFKARIQKTQNWKLLRYVIDFMTAGVATARHESKPSGWIPFRFPQRIKALSISRATRNQENEIGKKIKRKMHLSTRVAKKEVLPYLRIIFDNNPQMAAGLTSWFNFTEEEVNHVAGGKRQAKKILKHLEM
jgi:replication factor C large subunit